MDEWAKLLITIVCSVVASGGFWSYLQARREKKDAKTKLLLGLHMIGLCHLRRYILRAGTSLRTSMRISMIICMCLITIVMATAQGQRLWQK